LEIGKVAKVIVIIGSICFRKAPSKKKGLANPIAGGLL
jgi:hypothetical protein